MSITQLSLTTSVSLLLACQPKAEEEFATGSTDVDESDTNVDAEAADETEETDESGLPIWTGPTIIFTKESGADPTDPANQDAITDGVVLTRGTRGSLMNVVLEDSANS